MDSEKRLRKRSEYLKKHLYKNLNRIYIRKKILLKLSKINLACYTNRRKSSRKKKKEKKNLCC